MTAKFEVVKVYVSNYCYFKVVKRTKHFLTIEYLSRESNKLFKTKLKFDAKYGGEYITLHYFWLYNTFTITAMK